jgi:chorismate mutase
MMRLVIPPLLLGLILPACGPSPAPPAVAKAPDRAFDGLLGLIRTRLELMHDVARYKWAARSPIEDPARERALLDDVAERGRALGLDPAAARSFFAAQIEAAKLIQRADFARWEADHRGPAGDPPDLVGVLRPRIDALNRDLLAALADARPLLLDRDSAARLRSRADQLLVGEGIDATVRTTVMTSFNAKVSK